MKQQSKQRHLGGGQANCLQGKWFKKSSWIELWQLLVYQKNSYHF
jgi:hypothetical protein